LNYLIIYYESQHLVQSKGVRNSLSSDSQNGIYDFYSFWKVLDFFNEDRGVTLIISFSFYFSPGLFWLQLPQFDFDLQK